MTWIFSLLVLVVFVNCADASSSSSQDQFQTIDNTFTSRGVYGTELFILENEYREERSYRFEDFFWTGSGDGDDGEDDYSFSSERPAPTTIYETKTVVTTLYVETSPPTQENTTTNDPPTKCAFNCEPPTATTEEITPTPTQHQLETSTNKNEGEGEGDDFFDADRQFWLLTVLKSDGKDPVIIDLKNSLAKLYKTAFQRQQDKHLGIGTSKRKRRDAGEKNQGEKPVRVYIHNVEKSLLNGDENIQVLYHVSVSGKPVDAVTAAEDMTLISDDEVRDELGYPFLIKAEPYLKPAQPESLSRENNTWIFIGVSIMALLIVLLVVAFLTLGLTKRKRMSSSGIDNRKQIFERGVDGVDNEGFVQSTGKGAGAKDHSPTYINFRNQPSNQTVRSSAISGNRPQSSLSSSSSSLDISPLMALKKHPSPPRKPPRPKAAVNMKRIAPELFDSDSSASRRGSPDTIFAENYDPGVVSPKSYLSMPSVKAFPRGTMPEPLNKVLEPVSVLHLDIPDDTPRSRTNLLVRHGSIGAVADPGVIGPVVWNMHCQRLQHGVSVDEGIDDLKVASNVSRMRKRFHDLLDDTFSLFGSRRDSPVDEYHRAPPIEVKSHSAVSNRPSEEVQVVATRQRPKTTDLRRDVQSPGSSGPRGAWASTAPSPLVRPLSADVLRKPQVNVRHILADGKFQANDPAVPLIAAIRNEIERCSLPGSTADLRQ